MNFDLTIHNLHASVLAQPNYGMDYDSDCRNQHSMFRLYYGINGSELGKNEVNEQRV